ncbi:MAG: hypothetical protein R3Y35_13220 [Clostridia bacterium]
MTFLNNICFITEDVRALAEFYCNIFGVQAEINDVHVNIDFDGGGLTIYSKSAAEHDMGFNFEEYNGNDLQK